MWSLGSDWLRLAWVTIRLVSLTVKISQKIFIRAFVCLLPHQHCAVWAVALSFRTLSLCPVLWSDCCMHTLSGPLKNTEDWEGGGGGGVLFPVLNFLGKILILCLFFLIHPFDFFSLPLAFLSLILLLLTLFWIAVFISLLPCSCLWSLSPVGQGASWDHPTGESQHQGGGGAQETCEYCLIRDLILKSSIFPWLLCLPAAPFYLKK